MVIYRCNQCKREYDSRNYFISISADNNSLKIENKLDNAKLLNLDFHSEINFCSKTCFIDFFFKESQ